MGSSDPAATPAADEGREGGRRSGGALTVVRAVRRVVYSRAVAVTVMAAMGVVMALAALVPESLLQDQGCETQLKEQRPVVFWIATRLRPQAVAAHPAFFLLPAYLFVGISLSIGQRLRQYRAGQGSGPGAERFKLERSFTLQGDAGHAAAFLERHARVAGYQAFVPHAGGFTAGRGRGGFFGSLAFHVGLLLTLGGTVVSGFTRFRAEIILTEGFPKEFTTASMHGMSHAERFAAPPGHSVAIRDFVAEYAAVGSPVDYAALMSIMRQGERVVEEQVRVNQAFYWRGYQLTLYRYGYAPELTATRPDGTTVVDAVHVLQVVPAGKADTVPLEGGDELKVRFYPDFALRDGRAVTRSLAPRQPVLLFSWRDAAGNALAEGRVARGETAVVNGYRVKFAALSYWGGFLVARDLGLWLFAVGSALGAAGLGVRFAYPDQRLRVACEAGPDGTRCHLTAGTRFFPALHEERIDQLVAAIEEEAARASA